MFHSVNFVSKLFFFKIEDLLLQERANLRKFSLWKITKFPSVEYMYEFS